MMKKIIALLVALACAACCFSALAEEILGGWNLDEELTEENRAVFHKALEGLTGVSYELVACLGSQAAAGTNYCFLCRATVVYPGAKSTYKLVYVYADLDGGAEITRVCDLDIAKLSAASRVVEPMPVKTDTNALAGTTVYAIPGEYSREDGLLTLTLIEPEAFAAEDIRALQPGDVIVSGGREYRVDTLMDNGYYLIVNPGEFEFSDGSLWMVKDGEGNYLPVEYEDYIWREAGQITCALTDDAVFLDGIVPESGEPLDEPTRHTAAEFLRMRETEEYLADDDFTVSGPGFSTHNFRVSFGADGQLATLERFYVPWQ